MDAVRLLLDWRARLYSICLRNRRAVTKGDTRSLDYGSDGAWLWWGNKWPLVYWLGVVYARGVSGGYM